MSFLSNLVHKVENTASRVYDQVNPFDNGLSYQTRQVNPAVAGRSVVQQVGNEAQQVVRRAPAVAQGFVRAPAQFVNTAVNTVPMLDYTIRQNLAAHTNNPTAYVNATRNLNAAMSNFTNRGGVANVGTFIEAPMIQHGGAKQVALKTLGNTIATEASVLPMTKGGSIAANVVKAPLKKAIPRLAADGAVYTGAYSVGDQLQQNGKVNAKQLAKDTALGTLAGVALPVGARGAGVAARKTAEGAHTAASATKFAITEKTGRTFNGLKPNQVLTDPNHLQTLDNVQSMLRDGSIKDLPAREHNVINQTLHDIKNKHGLDFITGSNDARASRIEQYQQQWHEGIKRYQDRLARPQLLKDEVGSIGRNVRNNTPNDDYLTPQAQNQIKDLWKKYDQTGDDSIISEIDRIHDEDVAGQAQAQRATQHSNKPLGTRSIAEKSRKLLDLGETGHTGSTGNPFFEAGRAGVGAIKKQLDVNEYVKQQTQLQKAARKAGNPHGLGRVSAETSDLKTKLVDSFAPIEDKVNQAIKNGAEIAPENNIKFQLDRAIRGDTLGTQFIRDNGLDKIIQSVPNTKEFDQYLIAKHSPDLEKLGVKTGRNVEADKQLVEALAPQYEHYAQAINQYSHKLLDSAVEYGLISKELAAHLKQKYPNYVPMNRIFSEEEQQAFYKGQGGGKASISQQSVVKKIKGSERQVESPLSSLVDKSIEMVKQGEKNKAAQMLTSYRDLPGNPFELRELGKSETVGAKPVISVLENGKVRRFETSPEIAIAAKSLDKQQIGLIGQIFAVPTRVLRLGATGINVGFAGANVAKDVASAFINSKHPFQASVGNPEVFVASLKAALNHNSPEYQELVRQAAGGTSYDIARNAPTQNVRQIRMQKNLPSKALYTVTNPAALLRAVENTIGRSEEFNRAIQYFGNKQAFMKETNGNLGRSQILAADAARNNTVNFARAGNYGRVINTVLPYLNAGIQGSRTLMRNVKDRPLQTAAKIAVVGFVPTATVTAWNLSDPKRREAYDDIKEYEKQGNIIIVPPNPHKDPKTGRWNVIKIPVSQEIANLNNIVRNGVEVGMKDGSIHPGQIIGDVVATATSIKANSWDDLQGQAIPQAVKPIAESINNRNFFTGNQIVPDSQKNLDPRDQYGDFTSGTAKVIGRTFNLSPRKIDNTIRTGAGGVGQNVINASDRLLAKTGQIKPDEVKGKDLGSSITNRFSGAQGKSPYDIADEKLAAASKQLKQLPDFKSMSPADKAKALNRLKSDSTKAFIPAKDGKQVTLSPRQQHLAEGHPDLKSYLTAQKTGSTKASKNDPSSPVYSSNDAEYKAMKAEYDKNMKENKLSTAAQIKAETALNKAKVGASYPKEVRDLYGLSKAQLNQYLSTNPKGAELANQIVAYGDALKDAGINPYNKFRNSRTGAVSIAPSARTSSGGTRRSSGGGTARRSSGGSRRTGVGSRGGRTTTAKATKQQLPKFNNTGNIRQLASFSAKAKNATVKSKSSGKISFSTKIKKQNYKLAKLNRKAA